MIPEICGKLEFPDVKGTGYQRKVYAKWYDTYIYPYERPNTIDGPQQPWILNGDILYELRNALYHEGSIDIEDKVLKDLKLKEPNKLIFHLTPNITSYGETWDGNGTRDDADKRIRVGVRDLCLKIAAAGEAYFYQKLPEGEIPNRIVKIEFDHTIVRSIN